LLFYMVYTLFMHFYCLLLTDTGICKILLNTE